MTSPAHLHWACTCRLPFGALDLLSRLISERDITLFDGTRFLALPRFRNPEPLNLDCNQNTALIPRTVTVFLPILSLTS